MNEAGTAGACASKTPAQVIAHMRSDAEAYKAANPTYGFAGDPHSPIFGGGGERYYGFLGPHPACRGFDRAHHHQYFARQQCDRRGSQPERGGHVLRGDEHGVGRGCLLTDASGHGDHRRRQFSWNGASTVMTFDPNADLVGGHGYDITVSTGATDAASNPLAAAFASTFTTSEPIPPPPAVSGVSPVDEAAQVSVGENVVVTFSEAMNQSSVKSAFSLQEAGSSSKLSGSYSWNPAGTQLTFNPSANLLANTGYNVAVTTAAKDLAGNAMASAFSSSFATDSIARRRSPVCRRPMM